MTTKAAKGVMDRLNPLSPSLAASVAGQGAVMIHVMAEVPLAGDERRARAATLTSLADMPPYPLALLSL